MSGAVFCWKQNPQSYDTSMPVYDVYADEDILMKVTLRSVNPRTRLGIMTISDWELEKMEFCAEAFGGELPGVGTGFSYDISVPDTCRVTGRRLHMRRKTAVSRRSPQPVPVFPVRSMGIRWTCCTLRSSGAGFSPTT